jgi:hypothetical protein
VAAIQGPSGVSGVLGLFPPTLYICHFVFLTVSARWGKQGSNPTNPTFLVELTLPQFLSSSDWSLAFEVTLLGGDGGGPRSGAVRVAKRSGPPVGSVDRWAHPTKPRVRPVGVAVRAPGFERNARMG